MSYASLLNRRRVRAAVVDDGGGGGDGEPFFSDSFAGGVQNSANGFVWYTLGGSSSIVTESPHSGTHCLKTVFGPTVEDSNGNQGGDVEISFSFGRDLTEVWIEYWMKVGANYYHRKNATASSNNKMMILWRNYYDPYIEKSFMVGVESLPNLITNPNGGSVFRPVATNSAVLTTSDLDESRPAWFAGDNGIFPVNQWSRQRAQIRVSSAPGVSDGIYKWRVDDTLLYNLTGLDFNNKSDSALTDCVLKRGYFLGSCDSGFTEATPIYLDDFKFYDTNPGW